MSPSVRMGTFFMQGCWTTARCDIADVCTVGSAGRGVYSSEDVDETEPGDEARVGGMEAALAGAGLRLEPAAESWARRMDISFSLVPRSVSTSESGSSDNSEDPENDAGVLGVAGESGSSLSSSTWARRLRVTRLSGTDGFRRDSLQGCRFDPRDN